MKQSQSGTIAFYSQKGDFLFERKYRKVHERKAIIDFANTLYGKAFARMYYQIRPDISEKKLAETELPRPKQAKSAA